MDASVTGWGVHMNGLTTQGFWMTENGALHISYLALKAVLLAARSFMQLLMDQPLAIYCDKTTSVSYISKRGHGVQVTVSPSHGILGSLYN